MSISNLEKVIETDVLVVGGGMAGIFAAVKARESGLDITLTDKAFAGKSGSTHYSEGDLVFFRPERGHNLKDWVDQISAYGEYINNREWDEILLTESEETFNDLKAWGVEFYQHDGQTYIFSGMDGKPGMWEDVTMIHRKYAPVLRQQALASGVRILDNIMICELLKQAGRIVGAVGIHTISGNLYIIKAKATVLATGSWNVYRAEYVPIHYATGDGEALAYRAGAEVAGKEFTLQGMVPGSLENYNRPTDTSPEKTVDDVFSRFPYFRGDDMVLKFPPTMNAEGGPVFCSVWEVHQGRAPLYYDLDVFPQDQIDWATEYFFPRIGKFESQKIGFDLIKRGKVEFAPRMLPVLPGSGIWPIDKNCATGLEGLFAAGNSCATMGSGANYAGMGFGSNQAAVTGKRAGHAASRLAAGSGEMIIDETELARAKDIVRAPLERRGGFSPAWVNQLIRNATIPYFVLGVKHEQRLTGALSSIEFINSHLVPKLRARDSHELRRAHEVRNMGLHAEMVLRASLFRRESRGAHFREDYPERVDPEWLAWVKIRADGDEMKVYKEPVPEKWWPDLTSPYLERYHSIFTEL